MNSRSVGLMLVAALVSPSMSVWADDQPNPVTHPIQAYEEKKVDSNEKDIQKDQAKLTEANQAGKEQKERFSQARKDYEESLAKNGPESEITKQAKKRLDDSRKELRVASRKHMKARKEMAKDQKELQDAKQDAQKSAQ